MYGRSCRCLLAISILILAPSALAAQSDDADSARDLPLQRTPRQARSGLSRPISVRSTACRSTPGRRTDPAPRARNAAGHHRTSDDGSSCRRHFFGHGDWDCAASRDRRPSRRNGRRHLPHRECDSRSGPRRRPDHLAMGWLVVGRPALPRRRTCARFPLSPEQTRPHQLRRRRNGAFQHRSVGPSLAFSTTSFSFSSRSRPWWEVAPTNQRLRLGGTAGQ